MITYLGRLGYVAVILLSLVGLESVGRRSFLTLWSLADPEFRESEAAQLVPGNFDTRYYDHPYLTLAHAAAGALFMILGPLQFMPAIRNRFWSFHRWSGRVFIVASFVSVITALALVGALPIFGTFTARIAAIVGGSLFLFVLMNACLTIWRRDFVAHREWMIRTFAIGLGISTFRVLIPPLMIVGASFPEAWDAVVWLGFIVNGVLAEIWINLTRSRPAPIAASSRKVEQPQLATAS